MALGFSSWVDTGIRMAPEITITHMARRVIATRDMAMEDTVTSALLRMGGSGSWRTRVVVPLMFSRRSLLRDLRTLEHLHAISRSTAKTLDRAAELPKAARDARRLARDMVGSL